jgi:hypothetical protein
MLFYQAVFQQPGINFGINNSKGDITDLGNQYPGFGIYIGILIKIGINPVAQVLCLANIDQLPLVVPKLVNAGFMRNILIYNRNSWIIQIYKPCHPERSEGTSASCLHCESGDYRKRFFALLRMTKVVTSG